jgi:internalin-related protein
MKSVFQKCLIALLAILWGVSSVQAQSVNMSRYITMTVKSGENIELDFSGDADGTQVKIVSGAQEQTVTVGTSWIGPQRYTAGAGTMTVYGNVSKFNCNSNVAKITGLDASHNSELKSLLCYKNKLSSLDISKCGKLTELDCGINSLTSLNLSSCGELIELDCSSNSLTSLDVTRNTKLTDLSCYDNKLTSIDVSKNTQLILFSCSINSITSLDVKNNTKLEEFFCHSNSLTSLDISSNTRLVRLNCSNNKIESLDLSNNMKLQFLFCFANSLTSLKFNPDSKLNSLYCYDNKFTTAALDDIYCSLPDRKGLTAGVMQPLHDASSPDKDIVLATNGSNATSKNWKILYFKDFTDIKGFTGTHQCGGGSGVNMERYITFAVKKGAKIEIDFAADEENTPVKIVSGTTDQTITVGVDWVGSMDYVAGDATMTVYGNVRRVDCNENKGNITALDASHNVPLAYINCDNNSISSLNVSKNTQLSALYCSDNSLSTLDVSNNGQLEYLNCYNNKLTQLDLKNNTKLTFLNCGRNTLASLDLSKNTQLSILYCNDNKLTSLSVDHNILLKSFGCNNNLLSSLDVSKNTQLDILYCYTNRLTKLDVSKNTQLKRLYCHTNNFTTAALDDIYCSLPDRKGQTEGQIQPLFNASSADKSKVLATNGNNAIAKGWKIQYFEKNTDITGFTGTHQCGGSTGIDEAKDLPALAVYPNPVKDILNIISDTPVHSIRIYNVYGTEVAHANDTNSVNVSHLPAGVYMVRADGKVARIIKE